MEKTDVMLLEQFLDEKNYKGLREAFNEMNDVDIAAFIESLPRDRALIAFRTLSKDTEMDVFAELSTDMQQYLISFKSEKEIAHIIDELWVDDAVELLEEMPAKLVNSILKNSSHETRELINKFLNYPKNSAGNIMTAEFTGLRRGSTVEDAIKRIRRVGEDKETIYTCFVIDETRVLMGVVTVKDLLLANDDDIIDDIMVDDVISVHTHEEKEQAVKLIDKYDLMSLPVVDNENRLVGIITVDDAMDVILDEDTEDFQKMAAMVPSEKPYLKTSVFSLALHRFPWLLILMISGILAEGILGHYEAAYATIPLLVSFIPMITGTGGNAGSQVSTTIIRGMALGEIDLKDTLKVLWKETRISIIVGIGLSLANMVRMIIMYPGEILVSIVVSLTLIATIFISKIISCLLPMLAKACKLDPALMAAPVLTTIVDVLGLIVYFNIAKLLLPI